MPGHGGLLDQFLERSCSVILKLLVLFLGSVFACMSILRTLHCMHRAGGFARGHIGLFRSVGQQTLDVCRHHTDRLRLRFTLRVQRCCSGA